MDAADAVDRALLRPHVERTHPYRYRYRVHRAMLVGAALIAIYSTLTVIRVYERRYYVFLSSYVTQALEAPMIDAAKPTHIFFLFTDHFEPDWSVELTRIWADRYRIFAARHLDSNGRPAQHTWTYPGDQIEPQILEILRQLVRDGFGEVELHYHHDSDTAATLAAGLQSAIAEFQKFGFLKTMDGRTAFAFVHGNSGLDNSDGQYCGVDEELRVLHDLGCFADFTFPALFHDAQPPIVNRIYAAREDGMPKSYRTPWPLLDLKRGAADLMIFQGPVTLAPSWNFRRLFLEVDDGDIHPGMPANAARVHRWVNARVHVAERPDWVFVKVWGHTVSTREDEEEMLGPNFDAALTELEQHFNDGRRNILHYVTAREAYNLAMAAAAGATGDPSQYLNYEIPPYVAHARTVLPESCRRSDGCDQN